MVKFTRLIAAAVSLAGIAAAAKNRIGRQNGFANGPFSTKGSDIVDASGAVIKLAGTNWPGHGEVMVPEGLQHQSIEKIVTDLKALGTNVIRLTFAIQMVDEIYANSGKDIGLKKAFTQGLGEKNGTAVLAQVLKNNPQFSESTKRIEVFDAVVKECAKNEIYVVLDNHISRGEWCCSGTDGNGWWGDKYFNADNWVRGLSYMAKHGKSWSNLIGVSLRNEFRPPTNNPEVAKTYNWQTWYPHNKKAANAVNAANPDVLVILSGLNYDLDMRPVVQGTALTPGKETFKRSDFKGYGDKLVIELHNYQTGATSCADLSGAIYNGGAHAMNPDDQKTVNVFPVLLTEFGFIQDGKAYRNVYATCLAEWLPKNTAGWMYWVVAGTYYTRQGIQNYDDTWGLYKPDWSDWRDKGYINELFKPMAAATLGD